MQRLEDGQERASWGGLVEEIVELLRDGGRDAAPSQRPSETEARTVPDLAGDAIGEWVGAARSSE